MITMNDWITIKNLRAKNPSISLREIARFLHVSHNTVKKALEGKSPPVYQRPEKLNPDIEPFKEVIFEMVNVKKFLSSRSQASAWEHHLFSFPSPPPAESIIDQLSTGRLLGNASYFYMYRVISISVCLPVA